MKAANALRWSVLGGGEGVVCRPEGPVGLELSEAEWRVRPAPRLAGEGGGPFSNCLWQGAVLSIPDLSQTDGLWML